MWKYVGFSILYLSKMLMYQFHCEYMKQKYGVNQCQASFLPIQSLYVSAMKWSEVKWSEVKWSEVKWSEVKWSEVKWSEVKWSEVKTRDIYQDMLEDGELFNTSGYASDHSLYKV
jgi:hypothetical protein